MKRQQPSRWLWLAPVSTSLLAGWLTLQGLAPAAAPASSVAESKMGTPPAVRVMALVQTAAVQAVESAPQRQGSAAGQALGQRVGELAAKRLLQAAQ